MYRIIVQLSSCMNMHAKVGGSLTRKRGKERRASLTCFPLSRSLSLSLFLIYLLRLAGLHRCDSELAAAIFMGVDRH